MLYKLNKLYLVDDILYAIGGERLVNFFDDVLLEPFVKIPWFENPIRSYLKILSAPIGWAKKTLKP